MASPLGGVLSLLSSLSFFLSPPPPLSLSLFLSLSLSQSLAQGAHSHRNSVETMLILTVDPLTLHPTASTWMGEIRGA